MITERVASGLLDTSNIPDTEDKPQADNTIGDSNTEEASIWNQTVNGSTSVTATSLASVVNSNMSDGTLAITVNG